MSEVPLYGSELTLRETSTYCSLRQVTDLNRRLFAAFNRRRLDFRRSASRIVKRFRRGLVCKVHRLLCHSTLGLRVIKKKKKVCLSILLSTEDQERYQRTTFPRGIRGDNLCILVYLVIYVSG